MEEHEAHGQGYANVFLSFYGTGKTCDFGELVELLSCSSSLHKRGESRSVVCGWMMTEVRSGTGSDGAGHPLVDGESQSERDQEDEERGREPQKLVPRRGQGFGRRVGEHQDPERDEEPGVLLVRAEEAERRDQQQDQGHEERDDGTVVQQQGQKGGGLDHALIDAGPVVEAESQSQQERHEAMHAHMNISIRNERKHMSCVCVCPSQLAGTEKKRECEDTVRIRVDVINDS